MKYTLILPYIGTFVTFSFLYIILFFLRLVLPLDAIDESVSIFYYPIQPLLIWTLPFGYALGVLTYRTAAKTAAIWSSIFFSVIYLLFMLFIAVYYHEYKFESAIVYIFVIMASMGAFLGGFLSIVTTSVFSRNWPRFTLGELLTGFTLMAVILGCVTALARQSF